jgi:hypothetical protein
MTASKLQSNAIPTRATKNSALRRNEFVAALADEAFIAHITPGGQTAHIAELLKTWGVSLVSARGQ